MAAPLLEGFSWEASLSVKLPELIKSALLMVPAGIPHYPTIMGQTDGSSNCLEFLSIAKAALTDSMNLNIHLRVRCSCLVVVIPPTRFPNCHILKLLKGCSREGFGSCLDQMHGV